MRGEVHEFNPGDADDRTPRLGRFRPHRSDAKAQTELHARFSQRARSEWTTRLNEIRRR
jgi:hypothetical protein